MRQPLRHRWTYAAILVAMGLGLMGARLGLDPPLIVAVHKGIEGDALKKTMTRYTGPGSNFHVVELPYETLRNTVRDFVQGRRSRWDFDLVMIDDPWLPEIESALEVFLPEDVEEEEDFMPSCRRVSRSSRGHLVAVPFVGNSQLLCYRKNSALGTPPRTWEDLVRSSASAAAPGGFGYVMRVKSGNSILTDFLPMLWEASPSSLSGTGLVLNPDARKAFEQFHTLGQGRKFATAAQDDFDLAAYILRNKASMSIIWSAWAMQFGNLQKANPELLANYEFGQVPGRPVLGAWLLAVPSRSRRQKDAKAFVRFATSRKQLEMAVSAGNPPPRRSVLENGELKTKYPTFPQQLKSLEQALERPRTTKWSRVEEQVGGCLAALNAGLIDDPARAFQRSVEAVRALNSSGGGGNGACR